jgi:hypothetical protein
MNELDTAVKAFARYLNERDLRFRRDARAPDMSVKVRETTLEGRLKPVIKGTPRPAFAPVPDSGNLCSAIPNTITCVVNFSDMDGSVYNGTYTLTWDGTQWYFYTPDVGSGLELTMSCGQDDENNYILIGLIGTPVGSPGPETIYFADPAIFSGGGSFVGTFTMSW